MLTKDDVYLWLEGLEREVADELESQMLDIKERDLMHNTDKIRTLNKRKSVLWMKCKHTFNENKDKLKTE